MFEFEVEAAAGPVKFGISKDGELVYDERVTTALEYEMAFAAMGGSHSGLARFFRLVERSPVAQKPIPFRGLGVSLAALSGTVSSTCRQVRTGCAAREASAERFLRLIRNSLARVVMLRLLPGAAPFASRAEQPTPI